jgi:predicted N-acetyltransferase YhbS
MSIQTISDVSWAGILKVQDEAYIDIITEEGDILKSKWEASPDTCFVFQSEHNTIEGYVLSHPWGADKPPKLFEKHASDASMCTLFLHDLAVSKKVRGLGVGKQLAARCLAAAKHYQFKRILLVSVQGSEGFWSDLGFNVVDDTSICASYGVDAKLMACDI